MEHYVTLFDESFLPQGLALADSLERHGGEHTLWVLCMDEATRETLDRMARPGIRTIALSQVETPELVAVKAGRTRAEYCWTLTPFTPGFVFERAPGARRVTYVDADLCFLHSPRPIFEELEESGKAVLITEHAYDPEYDQSATSGRFCVQFVTFVRDAGEPVRSWWAERCLEWCFNRVEPGRFGDQKYLDDWPERFGSLVHVLAQLDAILAPWNARRFAADNAVAWHFQGLRIEGNRIRWYLGYPIPRATELMVYEPYVRALQRHLARLDRPIFQGRREWHWRALQWARFAAARLPGGSARLRQTRVTPVR